MTIEDIQAPQIRALLDQGIVRIGSERYSRAFDTYICQHYPWTGSSIRWSALEHHIHIDTAHLSEEELKRFFDATTLGRYARTAVIYGAWEPCVVLAYLDMVKYFDDLIRTTVQCYFVGVMDRNGEEIHSSYQDFVEFKLSSTLRISGVQRHSCMV